MFVFKAKIPQSHDIMAVIKVPWTTKNSNLRLTVVFLFHRLYCTVIISSILCEIYIVKKKFVLCSFHINLFWKWVCVKLLKSNSPLPISQLNGSHFIIQWYRINLLICMQRKQTCIFKSDLDKSVFFFRSDLDTFPTPGLLGYWPDTIIANKFMAYTFRNSS